MNNKNVLDIFLEPRSVAVIGATERQGAWGSIIMKGLLAAKYSGRLYPINKRSKSVYDIKTYSDIRHVPDPIDLAVIAIPEHSIEEIITSCGEKGVKGITIITAGFGEIAGNTRDREIALAELANSYKMRLLGPNVSGTFNLHAGFNASGSSFKHLFPTRLAGICQGGFALYDLFSYGFARKMGVGRFVQTGNECDLNAADFLEHFGDDPEIDGIIMYLETVRAGKRFIDVAKDVSRKKPIIVHKAGKTKSGIRAAKSHTGAIASRSEIYDGLFHQSNVIVSPTMELLLPVAHAAIERPPMRGRRVAIITMGGSWGVPLTDCLGNLNLEVPELAAVTQKKLQDLGMPERASAKNPVDIGAAGVGLISSKMLSEMVRIILVSGDVDALILHGLGRPGMYEKDASEQWEFLTELEKEMITNVCNLEKEIKAPVMIGTIFSPWESQTVHDLNAKGLRIYNSLDEIAQILSLMYKYWKNKLTA